MMPGRGSIEGSKRHLRRIVVGFDEETFDQIRRRAGAENTRLSANRSGCSPNGDWRRPMMRVDLTKIQVEAVIAMLRDELDEDEQLRLDCLEGQTDLFEILRRLLDEIEEDEGVQATLAKQIEERQARKQRAAHREKAQRAAVAALLECANLDKLALPEATLSLRKVPPKPIVIDEAAVPDEFCRFKRAPDMAAIRAEVEAGRAVSGVSLDNGSLAIAVRRK